jgi:iron(III) transport system substrate-binding protein
LLFYEYTLSDAQPLMLKLNYLSPLKKLPSALRGARMLLVDPEMDSAEVARCDKAYEALLRMKK